MKVRARRSPRIPMDGLSPNDRARLEQFLTAMAPRPVPTRPVDPGSTERRVGKFPGTDASPRKRGRRS